MGWQIGSFRIEESIVHSAFFVHIDGQRLLVQGERQFEIGKTIARVCVAFEEGRSELELWVGGQRIPRSPKSLEPIKAPTGSTCSRHGGDPRASYRAAAPRVVPAKVVCPGCGDALCRACLSVDRVRCSACLQHAAAAESSAVEAAKGFADRPLSGRSRGLLLLGCAALFSYFSVIAPIREAATSAPSIEFWVTGALMVPGAWLWAVAFLFAPAWTTKLMTDAERSMGRVAFGGATLILGGVMYAYVRNTLVSHGYVFR